MVRKKRNHFIEGILHKYAYDFFSFLFSSLEKGVEEGVEKFGDFFRLKKKLRAYSYGMMFMTAGLILVLYGIATLLGAFFITWPPGSSYFVVGIVVVIFAWIYKKYG